MAESNEISFKASYAKGQSFIVPVTLILPIVGSFIPLLLLFAILSATGHPQDPVLYAVLAFTLLISYLAFFHGHPWKKLGSMHSPPKVIVANQTFFEEDISKRVKPQIGTRKRENLKKEKEVVHPIEDKIHLAKMLRFCFDGLDFGAYLQENATGQLIVVWVFECKGISYSLSEDQFNAIGKTLQEGMADFSRSASSETLTFDAEVRSGCTDALSQTKSMRAARDLTKQDLFLLDGIDERTKALTRDGRIAPRHLRIYATNNLADLGFSEDLELFEKGMAWLEKNVSAIASPDNAKNHLRDSLIEAYEKGFKKWKRMIENKLELPIQTFSAKQAWQIAWNEINDGPAPAPNHLITISDQGLKIHKSNDPRLLASLLFHAGSPTLGKDFVYLPGRGEYVGACAMTAFPRRTWYQNQRKEQLFYGSSAINRSSALNMRVLVQLSTIPPAQAQWEMDWMMKGENSAKDWNAKHKLKDVGSEVMFEEAEEAARSLKKGATPIKFAWVAMVSRPSLRQLNDAIAELVEHSAFSGNILLREREYFDQMWLQLMPSLTSHKLLQKVIKPETFFSSFERRLKNEPDAVVGLLPIMKEPYLHRKGYQLVTQLKEPIYLDPLAKYSWDGSRSHINYILVGEKGSGKSKLIQDVVDNAMLQGARAIIIDGARSDGSGSFDTWAKFKGEVAYFNPNRDASNPFDAVDQRYLKPFDPDDEKSIDTWGSIESFLIQALTDLSYRGVNEEISSEHKELHSLFVGEFFRNPDIRARRDAAFDGGIGSEAWKGMPTLRDYLDLLCVKSLPERIHKYVNQKTLNDASGALYALLQQPLGRAIARPTTVDFDKARLIVYAMSAIRKEDMLPLGIAMTGSILTQTNKPGLKCIVYEECALNLSHNSIKLLARKHSAQGRKDTLHCFFVSQDIEPFRDENDIRKNSPITIVGAIVPSAVKNISEVCEIPREAVARCAEASFIPKDEEFGRNFLISTKEGQLFATNYSDFRSMYLVMNEFDEVALRTEMQALYPNQPGKQAFEGAKILRSRSIHAEGDRCEKIS